MDGPAKGHHAARRAVLASGLLAGLALRPHQAGQTGLLTVPTAQSPVRRGFAPPARAASGPAARQEWAHFKSRFMAPEGRVTDNMNGGMSHSEGQGFAMLLAVRFDEPDSFARLLRWTRGVLARPGDTLLSWSFQPGAVNPVPDTNNATDGDLLVAWALAEAARQWQMPEYNALAVAMCRDILGKLVVESSERATLLPGLEGFRQNDCIIVNPSYYVFPAFHALRHVLPSRQWAQLEESGLRLMRNARFGRWGLVPDWVSLPRTLGRPSLAPGRPARFSYDAMRVPLYMVWGGFGGEPAVGAAARFWHDPAHRMMPAWVDLRTDQTAQYAADPGIAAIASLAAQGAGRAPLPLSAAPPILPDAYYPAVLRLLARQADSASLPPQVSV